MTKEERETDECQGHEEERKFVESWRNMRHGSRVWRTTHGIHTAPWTGTKPEARSDTGASQQKALRRSTGLGGDVT